MKNIKEIKTTIIGLAIIAAVLFTAIKGIASWWPDACIGLGLGVALLLAPDRFLDVFLGLIEKKK